MHKIVLPILLLGTIFSLLIFNVLSQPINPQDHSKIEFQIESGQNLDSIADSLSQAKLIRSRVVFKLQVMRNNLAPKIQAGYFYLSPAMTAQQIAISLTKASTKDLRITIPEGLRRQEIANLIIDKLKSLNVPHRFDPEEFIKLTANREGRLFPSTYSLPENPSTSDILTRLESGFNQAISDLDIPAASLDKVITLASLIEREASSDSERPIIAGILTNRLNGDWPLQIDATVQFALANSRCRIRVCNWWPTDLTIDNLKLVSPYNTYQNQGLPPGPISNPGRASIEAASKPTTTQYWFYLHDPKGQIHYATTTTQHNQNVCTYLKKC